MRDAGARRKSLHQFVVLLRVEVAVSVQHDGDRCVTGHRGDVLGVGSFSDPERDGGVSEIVNAEWFEAGGGHRWTPDASTKECRPDRESLGRLEDQAFGVDRRNGAARQLVADERGEWHRSNCGFRRTHLFMSCTTRWMVAGARLLPSGDPRSATQARSTVRSSLPSGVDPKTGRACVRKNCSSRAFVLGRRFVTVGHHWSHHSPTVMRPSRGSTRVAVLSVDLGHVGEREGVTAALELLRTLLAVSGPEPHEVGLRAVAQLLVDDRCHGRILLARCTPGARTLQYETTLNGRKIPGQDHFLMSTA